VSKKVTVRIVGTGNPVIRDATLEENTETTDLLRSLGLAAGQITRIKTGETLQAGENLYKKLDEFEKLDVFPESNLGGGNAPSIFSRIKRRLGIESPTYVRPTPPRPYTERKPQPSGNPFVRQSAIHVLPSEMLGIDAELNAHGWKKSGRGYFGKFKSSSGGWYDAVLMKKGSAYSAFIRYPSKKIISGRHGLCFNPCGDNWYSVHFSVGRDNHPLALIAVIQNYIYSVGG
jgi:hypothetical protein